MIVISMALVLAGLVLLLLGVLGAGDRPLQFVYASIGSCLAASVFLVAGILRARPARQPAIVDDPGQPTWSGALAPPPATPGHDGEPGAPHVQVLSARAAARDAVAATGTEPLDLGAGAAATGEEAEHERFVQALSGLDLDDARIERLRGRFVTLERLTSASSSELAEVPGISAAMAETVRARLRSPD